MIMKNQSLFSKIFILLILFVVVPVVVIASIISYHMTRYSEDEISKSILSKLKASDKLAGLTADNLAQRALELTKSSSMINLEGLDRYSDVFSSADEMMKLYDVENQITALASSSSSLHSVYLYIDGADYILTSNQGAMDLENFADTGWMAPYAKFKSAHPGANWLSTRTVKFSKTSVDGELGASNKVITFFCSFTPYTTSVKGVLVFNIYEPAFRRMLNDGDSSEDGYIEVVNTNGYVVSDIHDDMVGKNVNNMHYFQQIKNDMATEGYLIENEGGKRLLISYYKSDYNNWIYLGIFQAGSMMAKINQLRSYTIIICLALIVAGTLISYFASKRIYSPLKNLLQDIREKKGIDIKGNDSDMSILSRAYDNLLRDRDRLSSFIENKESNKNAYLTNLIKGKNEEYLDKELTGIDFHYSNYICAVIQIDRYHEFETAYTRDQQEYMRMFILNISEELLNSDFICAGTVYEKKKIVLIINYNGTPYIEMKNALQEVFIQIQNEIGKIIDNTISVGIGSCQDNKDGIGDSFEKGFEALRYKLINGNGSINFWEDTYSENSVYYYPFMHEKYIFNILNAGIKDKLEDVITELIRDIKENSGIEYDNIIQIFNQLIGNTVKYLLDAHYNVGMIFGNNYNIYNALSKKETLDDIREWLIIIYSKIVDYMAKVQSQSKNHFERALDYIHKNYRKEIDIQEVAEYAGISYSHLRKIFRDEAGENIVNYINSLRIKESKRLLCMTEMTLKEISSTLGYNNDQSFVRFFKKYERVTPGEFRASNKKMASLADTISSSEL